MLRAAIVERIKDKRELIKAGIANLKIEIQVSEFSNEYDFKEKLDEYASSFDILLVNTSLRRDGDGVELARQIRKLNSKIMICFLSESGKYYAEAFSVFATGYLIYPFDIGELHNCINFFYQKEEPERRASWMIKETGGNYRRIYCRNITYIESSNREIIIHLEDGSTIDSYAKLSSAEEELPTGQFLRCHQSYLVNLYFVSEMERECFHIDGIEVPISRKFQKLAKEAYYEFIFKRM